MKKAIKAFFTKNITDDNILNNFDESSMEHWLALAVGVDPDESSPPTEQYNMLDGAFQTLSAPSYLNATLLAFPRGKRLLAGVEERLRSLEETKSKIDSFGTAITEFHKVTFGIDVLNVPEERASPPS